MLIEEALEPFDISHVANQLGSYQTHRAVSRVIVNEATLDPAYNTDTLDGVVNQLDAFLDSIVLAYGGIFQLGLSPQDAQQALSIVTQANMQKVANPTFDEAGKLLKPADFVNPEAKLLELVTRIKETK